MFIVGKRDSMARGESHSELDPESGHAIREGTE